MAYSLYIERYDRFSDIETMCEDYVIDDRGISLKNPVDVNSAGKKNTDVLHVDRHTYKRIYVTEIDYEEMKNATRVLGGEYGDGKKKGR